MVTPKIEMRYFETYYFANIVHGVIDDAGNYLVSLSAWGGDENRPRFLTAFPRWSHLHSFIAFIVGEVIHERIGETQLDLIIDGEFPGVWIDEALRFHDIDSAGFIDFLNGIGRKRENATEDDLYDYYQELWLTGEMERLINHITEEIFLLVFINRSLLASFNHLASVYVGLLEAEGDDRLARSGVLKRRNPPMWAKRAVFYRDRGRCSLCNSDLTGIVSLQNSNNFDHIIPLASSGLNDVSNLQLLCIDCNSKKGADSISVSRHYERWYEIRESDVP